MSYWDPEAIEKRIRKRYARRFLYMASVLIVLLFFIVMLSDQNLRQIAFLVFVFPIAHTAYLLFEEFSERALERELKAREKVKNEAESTYRLTNDGEVEFGLYEEPDQSSRGRSRNRRES